MISRNLPSIFSNSFKFTATLRVAYQGVPGAYSAGKAYPNCEAIPCDQFEIAFQAVELWIADRAVLPVENSLGGSIHRNYDLLLRHHLHIVGEIQLPVHHCLLALPGVRKEYLTRVIGHPQALSQCELTLTKLGLNVAREAVDDTAGAAEFVAANNLRDTAAIASARAADLYGLQIMADGIQDDSSNVTRFVMSGQGSMDHTAYFHGGALALTFAKGWPTTTCLDRAHASTMFVLALKKFIYFFSVGYQQ